MSMGRAEEEEEGGVESQSSYGRGVGRGGMSAMKLNPGHRNHSVAQMLSRYLYLSGTGNILLLRQSIIWLILVDHDYGSRMLIIMHCLINIAKIKLFIIMNYYSINYFLSE